MSGNSAAAKAGVEEGDVIVELNGKKVTDPRKLSLLVAQTPPGSKVDMRVLRGSAGGKPTEKNLTATLAELPQEKRSRAGSVIPRRTETNRPRMRWKV